MTDTAARPILLTLLGLMMATTLLFWLMPLDLMVSGLFYDPQADRLHAWPVKENPFVQFCYKAAPALTLTIALPALFIVLFGGWSARLKRWRAHAGVIVLTVILGPGLLVNAIFKDHWDRARPVQTTDFGGPYPYTPPLKIGQAEEGKSFPCGHCSAGFALAALWLLLRRHRRGLALAALVVALLLGASMGFSRMAAGGHYLSDVIWSAWLSFFAAWLSYYVILRIPQREAGLIAAGRPWPKPLLWAAYGMVGAGVVGGALMATPVDLHWRSDVALNPGNFVLNVEHARPEIVLVAGDHGRMQVEADWQGFGLPGATLHVEQTTQSLRLRPEGLFSELRDQVRVRVTLSGQEELSVELGAKQRLRVRCEGHFASLPLTLNLPPERMQLDGCPQS